MSKTTKTSRISRRSKSSRRTKISKTSRTSRRSRSSRTSRTNKLDTTLLDKLIWRIVDSPQQALLSGKFIDFDDYFSVVATGSIKLLLPTSLPKAGDVFILDHMLEIKKQRIRVADILTKIFNFYNSSEVMRDDILHLQVVSSAKQHAEKLLAQFDSGEKVLHFKDFLETSNLSFSGLTNENSNIYSVIIR